MMWKSLVVLVMSCCAGAASEAARSPDVANGRNLAVATGCAGCHAIPGAGDGRANVGPPLTAVGRRAYIAGLLPNSRSNMALWITDTQKLRPGDAMPSTRLDADQAADLVAFLETLR